MAPKHFESFTLAVRGKEQRMGFDGEANEEYAKKYFHTSKKKRANLQEKKGLVKGPVIRMLAVMGPFGVSILPVLTSAMPKSFTIKSLRGRSSSSRAA